MPIDGGKNSVSGFEKIQNKIMNDTYYPEFDKLAEYFGGKNKSVVQVMKDEIADDENNHFIVENRNLKEYLQQCLDWIKDNPPNTYGDMVKSDIDDILIKYENLIYDGDKLLNA